MLKIKTKTSDLYYEVILHCKINSNHIVRTQVNLVVKNSYYYSFLLIFAEKNVCYQPGNEVVLHATKSFLLKNSVIKLLLTNSILGIELFGNCGFIDTVGLKKS